MRFGPIHTFLAEDHARLDELLERALARDDLDLPAYEAFREGLLRHIAMEEKVLLPDAKRRRAGEPLPAAKQLRADHSALAALLVPTPTPEILSAIRTILEAHNRIEEARDGVYASAESLAGTEADALLARLRAVPSVPVAAHVDTPRVQAHIAALLAKRIPR